MEGGERVSENGVAEHSDAYCQVQPVEGIWGIVPSDELTSGCQWSACPCPEKAQPWRDGKP